MKKVQLIGNASELFDGNVYNGTLGSRKLKASIVQDAASGTIFMLVHTNDEPLRTVADALIYYLLQTGQPHCTVRGGCHISFRERQIIFQGDSLEFGFACREDIKSIVLETWPLYQLTFGLPYTERYISQPERVTIFEPRLMYFEQAFRRMPPELIALKEL